MNQQPELDASPIYRAREAQRPLLTEELEGSEAEEELAGNGGSKEMVCAACGAFVTYPESRVSIQGACEHTFVNPHGFFFHIECFGSAPGCRVEGAPTYEFSWFNRFAWSYAYCKSCSLHLGWKFVAAAELSFYGLICDRLKSIDYKTPES